MDITSGEASLKIPTSTGKQDNKPVEENVDKPQSSDETLLEQKRDVEEVIEEDLDKPYKDVKQVKIKLAVSHSLYRKVNSKALGEQTGYIGSSVSSTRTLMANNEELVKYFPVILGVGSSHQDFLIRVKEYLSNIRAIVTIEGLIINTTFNYYKKKDYLKIRKKEVEIETAYEKADKSSPQKHAAAVNNKINAIHELESTKHLYGLPEVPSDYILYRHCLLYSPIAKDPVMDTMNPDIKFYFEDLVKEKEKESKLLQRRNLAMSNYLKAIQNIELFDVIYAKYCLVTNKSLIGIKTTEDTQKQMEIQKYLTENPAKFNSFFANKDLSWEVMIETLIAYGELTRVGYSQNITDSSGNLIGANMQEAVLWFKNPSHNSLVNQYKVKLENI